MNDQTANRRDQLRAELDRADGRDPAAHPAFPKHRVMAANPFSFFRGSAPLFYTDIAEGTLVLPPALLQRPPLTAVTGDCHVSNFGFITEQGSHGERVVFCPNDFDDACIGPAAWDLARYVVSLLLAAEYCRGVVSETYRSEEIDRPKGLKAASADQAVRAGRAFLDAYRRTCKHCVEDADRYESAVEKLPRGHVLAPHWRKALKRAAGGRDFETRSALARDIEIQGGRPRFRRRPERFAPLEPARAEAVRDAFRPYVDDAILDLVQRLGAGTGSRHLERFYLLVGPADFAGTRDLPLCHLVEVKQQRPSAPLFRYPQISPVNRLEPAHLTVDCQRRMERRPDLVLDEALWEGRHWLVRSRHHARVGIAPEDIAITRKRPGKRIRQYAAACGEALALAHARGDRRSTRFEAAMTAGLKAHAPALIESALRYAERVKADRALLAEMLDGAAGPGT